MATIKDLSEATNMQIELMKWETRYVASKWNDEEPLSDEEIEAMRDLVERNPEYVASAYCYLMDEIDNATSKKQILMAWVHGECDCGSNAKRLYDEAMATNISIANARKLARASNTPKRKPQRKRTNGDATDTARLDWLDRNWHTMLKNRFASEYDWDAGTWEKDTLRDSIDAAMRGKAEAK